MSNGPVIYTSKLPSHWHYQNSHAPPASQPAGPMTPSQHPAVNDPCELPFLGGGGGGQLEESKRGRITIYCTAESFDRKRLEATLRAAFHPCAAALPAGDAAAARPAGWLAGRLAGWLAGWLAG
jgi:hypothetical protein